MRTFLVAGALRIFKEGRLQFFKKKGHNFALNIDKMNAKFIVSHYITCVNTMTIAYPTNSQP